MAQICNTKLDREEELTLFTCFIVATTPDEDGTERSYNTAECRGVARQLIKRKKPDFLDSKDSKTINIDWLRNKWRDQSGARPASNSLRRHVEANKAHYLRCADQLLQQYQMEPKSKLGRKKILNEPDQLRQTGGYGSFQVPGYTVSTPHGQPRTYEYTSTFQSQQSASSDPYPELQAPLDDSVSTAVGALSLSATAPPRGPYQYESKRIGGASLQNPVLQSSLTNRISDTNQTQAEVEEDSIVQIGDSIFNPVKDYVGKEARSGCRSPLNHRFELYYGAPGHVRASSPHAIENYNSWKSQAREKAKGEKMSLESSSSPSGNSDPPSQGRRLEDKPKPKPVLQIGDDLFKSSRDYLGSKRKNRCTSRGFPPSHDDDDYGALGTRSRLGTSPSPHAVENYMAWQKQAERALKGKGAAAEASSSSAKSKSPAYHEERRERGVEQERRGQSGKSRGSRSEGSSKQKDSRSKDDTRPAKSRGSKSGGGSKPKDSSKDDTQGGGRRRGGRK